VSIVYLKSINQHINFKQYDKIVVFFSGGKDSVDTVLSLFEKGIKPAQIELHHHLIDGDNKEFFMDWQCTESYCREFAKAFGLELYFSWKVGGFEGEMLRNNDFTGNKAVPDENGNMIIVESSKNERYKNTRLKYPQVSPDLSVRYCSSYLKIDIGDLAVRKRFDFNGDKKYLVVSGERAEESPNRAKYLSFEKYRADNRNGKSAKRYIDHLRIAHQDTEVEVWERMKRWKVNPHPAYHIGLGRTSCKFCIFANEDQWATLREYDPSGFQKVLNYEKQFNLSINRDGSFIDKIADKGKIFDVPEGYFDIANSTEYREPIIVDSWTLPLGAFKVIGGAI